MNRLVEIHVLQNHVPGNMNRDDRGAPKTCIFGGTQRLRVSSQCLKRAARTSEAFREALLDEKLAERTRAFKSWLVDRLNVCADKLTSLGLEDGDTHLLADAIAGYIKGKQGTTGAETEGDETDSDDSTEDLRKQPLVFLGEHELDALIEALLEKADAKELKKGIHKQKKKQPAPQLPDTLTKELEPINLPCAPVALFGRMTTSSAFEPVDAAVCVAHAISTHKVALEVDYWTAMGDRKEEERVDPGSDHIGERQFASATFYKYASIDLDQLTGNLGGSRELVEKSLRAFLKGLVMSYPSGMQTTMGHHNPPSAILIEQKSRKIPTNYANAFVEPLPVSESRGQIEASIEVLKQFSEKQHNSWVTPDSIGWWRYDNDKRCEDFIEEQVKLAVDGTGQADAA